MRPTHRTGGRLQNDDIGVILWGPDSAITLSVGKSDVWDRRLAPSEKPVLTFDEMVKMAYEGDPAILNGAAYYTGYNSYDFPCPKPVGQLILQLPFLGPDASLLAEESAEETVLTATSGFIARILLAAEVIFSTPTSAV